MTKRHALTVTAETVIGPDVDPERADARLAGGARLAPQASENR